MKYLIIVLLLAQLAFAQAFAQDEVNQKYSFGDFTDQSFTNLSASEFNHTTIVGSCFYQQHNPNTKIFPHGMRGVTFKRCNLDNVDVPPGNTVVTEGWERCSQKKIKVQNDLEPWVLDDGLRPLEPVNKEKFIELGISTNPKDIPRKKMKRAITIERQEAIEER